MFGRLSWAAIPFDQPIPLVTGAVVLVAILAVLAYRVTSPEERARYLAIAVDFLQQLRAAAAEPRPLNGILAGADLGFCGGGSAGT